MNNNYILYYFFSSFSSLEFMLLSTHSLYDCFCFDHIFSDAFVVLFNFFGVLMLCFFVLVSDDRPEKNY